MLHRAIAVLPPQQVVAVPMASMRAMAATGETSARAATRMAQVSRAIAAPQALSEAGVSVAAALVRRMPVCALRVWPQALPRCLISSNLPGLVHLTLPSASLQCELSFGFELQRA